MALKLGARQISWGDWLGTFSRSKKDSWAEFEVARSFVRSLNLNSRSEWDDYYENNTLPLAIPKTFWTVYKEDGFKSVQDFLGSQYAHANDRKWMSFKEAKRFVRTLNLKSQNEYKEYESLQIHQKIYPPIHIKHIRRIGNLIQILWVMFPK